MTDLTFNFFTHFGGERQAGLVTYCLSVSSGKSRIVAQFPRNFAKRPHKWIPRWWNHINERNSVLDGDMILLHYQERELQSFQSQSWKDVYILPTSADRMVIEFRSWIDRYCRGQLPWGVIDRSNESPVSNRQQILDRYHQHTIICGSCRQALKNVHRLQIGLLGYFLVAVSVAAIMPDRFRGAIGLPVLLTALLGLMIYVGLKYWLEPKFYFIDYEHAKR